MKARALVVAVVGMLVCLIVAPAVAQVTWEAGFKGGLGLGKLRGDTGFSDSASDPGPPPITIDLTGDIADFRTGFAAGGFVTASLTEAFGIRAEVLFVQKGGQGNVDVDVNGSPAGTAKVTLKGTYVEVPLLLVGSFPAGGKAKFNVFGGPAVAFKSSAKIRVEVLGQSQEQDIGDTVEGTDFGVAAGAGVSIAATPAVNIVIDGRYTLGLSKLPTTGEDIKNSGLAILAGLSFPLGGGSSAP